MQCALNGRPLISLIIPGVRYFGPIGGAVEGRGAARGAGSLVTSVIPAYNFSSAHLSRAPGPKHCIMCAGPCAVSLMYANQLFLSTALRSTEQKNCWDGCSGRRRASSHLCYLEISAAFALFNHSGVQIEDKASLSIWTLIDGKC